jgi:hypothetical protein
MTTLRSRTTMRERSIAALTILVMGAFGAHADSPGFIRSYGEWTALSKSWKSAHAEGAFDELILSRGTAEDLADSRGLSSCAAADGFTPNMLADLIDKRYAAHPEESSTVAASVLAGALIDRCKAQMNAARASEGLSPLTPLP